MTKTKFKLVNIGIHMRANFFPNIELFLGENRDVSKSVNLSSNIGTINNNSCQ